MTPSRVPRAPDVTNETLVSSDLIVVKCLLLEEIHDDPWILIERSNVQDPGPSIRLRFVRLTCLTLEENPAVTLQMLQLKSLKRHFSVLLVEQNTSLFPASEPCQVACHSQ